jgi:hypothetical protein
VNQSRLPRPHLAQLTHPGLNDGTDETFERYMAIMEKRARKITTTPATSSSKTLKAWHELRQQKSNSNH